MKTIYLCSLLLGLTITGAIQAGAAGTGKRFDKNKHKILLDIERQSLLLQQYKACVLSAANHQDIKECRTLKKSQKRLYLRLPYRS